MPRPEALILQLAATQPALAKKATFNLLEVKRLLKYFAERG